MKRVSVITWALSVVPFTLVLVGGCKSDSPSACDSAASKLRGCGLLSEGRFECGDDSPQVKCVASCLKRATCAQIEEAACSLTVNGTVERCIAACEFDVDCGDGSRAASCNGLTECVDGRDEAGCGNLFTCTDGLTVPDTWRCDGFPDCFDGGDELGCPTYTCGNGDVLSISYDPDCDGFPACPDGSDELGCPTHTCGNGQMVVVPNGRNATCDGFDDCSDGSDELGCPPEAEIICPMP